MSPAPLEIVIVETFDEFYAVWPRKVNKPAAKKAWAKAVKKTEANAIVEAATAYRDNPHRPDKQYIPYPATWLNAEGWNDELPGPRNSRNNGQLTPTERAMNTYAELLGTPAPMEITR